MGLNEIKWESMSSVTRIYNRCLKTDPIPEDCEVINMASHMGVGGLYASASATTHACSEYLLGSLGLEGDYLFLLLQLRKTPG